MRVDPAGDDLERGPYAPLALGFEETSLPWISVADAQTRLDSGGTQIIDLADSKRYRQGHIPGAWYAIRARLKEDLAKLPKGETLIVTSPDGMLAGLALSDLPDGTCALSGGTAAWKAAGLPMEAGDNRLASAPDDIRLKAREATDGDIEGAMRAYLAWEIDLVNQMAADDDHRFHIMTG